MIKIAISVNGTAGNIKYLHEDRLILERNYALEPGSKFSLYYQTIRHALIAFPLRTFELLIPNITLYNQLTGTYSASPTSKYYRYYYTVKYLLRSRSYTVTYYPIEQGRG